VKLHSEWRSAEDWARRTRELTALVVAVTGLIIAIGGMASVIQGLQTKQENAAAIVKIMADQLAEAREGCK